MKQEISTTPSAVERLTYSARETATAVGVSRVTLWRLESRQLLMPIPGLRHKIYSRDAVLRFVSGGKAAA